MSDSPDEPQLLRTRGTIAPPGGPGGVPARLIPGVRLGRWSLDRVIGEGATATVWAAHHSVLGTPVAIKVFSPRGLAWQQVLGEARAAAGIPSPNAIWVYDVDTFDGHHCIVMELSASGEQLAGSLRDLGKLAPERAARLVAQAARGVAAAHAGSVFHKDIKPANILVHPLDGRAQITDFGLANPLLWRNHQTDREALSTVALDDGESVVRPPNDPLAPIRGSLRVGTPEFMAPEQAQGLRRDLDPKDPIHARHLVAIDVWGLGATLYALLSGQAPYPHGPSPSGEPSAPAIMAQVATAPPLPLGSLTAVPRRLAAIVERAMRRDPLERYASATALADDLDAWCDDRPTSLDRGLTALGVHVYRERARALLVAALTVVTLGSTAVVARNAAEIDRQQADLAAAGQALRELEGSRDRLATQLRGTRESLEATRSELSEKTHRLDQQQEALGVAIAEVDRLAVDLDARAGDLETRNLELTVADARIQAMEDDLDALRRELDTLTNVSAGLELDLSATRARLANVSTDLDRTRSELVDELGRSATLDRSLADAVADADAQRRRAASAEERALDLERQRATLQGTVQTISARVAALESELALLRPP